MSIFLVLFVFAIVINTVSLVVAATFNNKLLVSLNQSITAMLIVLIYGVTKPGLGWYEGLTIALVFAWSAIRILKYKKGNTTNLGDIEALGKFYLKEAFVVSLFLWPVAVILTAANTRPLQVYTAVGIVIWMIGAGMEIMGRRVGQAVCFLGTLALAIPFI